MLVSAKQWHEGHGLEQAGDPDWKRLDDFLNHLACNDRLNYMEYFGWLSALRAGFNRKLVVAAYEAIFNLSFRFVDNVTVPHWTLANHSLAIELDPEEPGILQPSATVTRAERRLLAVLNELEDLSLTVEPNGEIGMDGVLDRAVFQMQLLEIGAGNLVLGAPKAATVFLSLAGRLGRQLGWPPILEAIHAGKWAKAISMIDEEAGAVVFVRALELFSKLEDVDPTAPASFWIDFAYFSLGVGDCLEEAEQALTVAGGLLQTEGLESHPDFPFLMGRYFAGMGYLNQQSGDVANGLACFEKSYEFLELAASLDKVKPAWDLVNVGRTRLELQHLAGDAVQFSDVEKLEKFYRDPRVAHRCDLLSERAFFELFLGISRMDAQSEHDDVRNALAKFQSALTILRSGVNDISSTHDIAIVLTLNNIGMAQQHLGNFEEARETLAECIQRLERLDFSQAVEMPFHPGMLYSNYAVALRHCGQLEASLEACRKGEATFKAGPEDSFSQPAVVEGYGKLIVVKMNSLLRLGRASQALEALFEVERVLARPEFRENLRLIPDQFRFFLTATKLLNHGLPPDWMVKASQKMSLMLEVYRPFDPQGDLLMALFFGAHHRWLHHAAQNMPEQVPLALSAIHGRILAQRLVPELKATRQSAPLLDRLRRMSEPLRNDRAAMDLHFAKSKQDFREALKASIVQDIERSIIEKGRTTLEENQKETHRIRNRFFQQSQAYLKDLDDMYAAIERGATPAFTHANTEGLQASLAENEALVCLLDIRLMREEAHEEIEVRDDEIRQLLTTHARYAWVLLRNGAVHCIELDLDLDPCLRFMAIQGRGMRNREMRGQSDEDRPTGMKSWPQLATYLSEHLWQPIQEILAPGIETVSVVSQGRFHRLPLGLGLPAGMELRQFLTLGLFAMRGEDRARNHGQGLLVLKNTDESLPIAAREGDPLLTSIWRRAETKAPVQVETNPRRIDAEGFLGCLHLSGHGDTRRERHRRWRLTAMTTDGETFLTEEDLQTMLPGAETVWLSACVVGLTQDNLEGDPVGLVIAFFLKGARHVVASLVPVPDFWMPLLMAMTEWRCRVYGEPFPNALRAAKQSLDTWPGDPEWGSFKPVYQTWLRETWAAIVAQDWQGYAGAEPIEQASWQRLRPFLGYLLSQRLAGFGIEFGSISPETFLPDEAPEDLSAHLNALMDRFVAWSLVPPPPVRDTLVHGVRLFSA